VVEYATRSLLEGYAAKLTINEQATVQKRAEDRSPVGATFLSHSSNDRELVVGAIRVLEGHGATVYIDKKDASLPPYTNKETARTLRQRIQETRKFVLLASKNSHESKWVPWELGIADGYKGVGRVAIFPALDEQHDRSWTRWEYLGLYDRIVWGDLEGQQNRVWMVLDEKANTATELSRWLSRA
jgi:hypothetical protein